MNRRSMDSLTERIKKNCLKGGVWTWDLIDQEIVAWKKERAEWLKQQGHNWSPTRDNCEKCKLIDLGFEISETGKVKDLGMCGKPVGIKDDEFGEYICAKDKPCPVHDKPKKKPSKRIYELIGDTRSDPEWYERAIESIIEYLNEQAESKG